MFQKIRKQENAIEIDSQLISKFDTLNDGNNEFYIFEFNTKKILYAPHGLFPSYKILKNIDIYIGSGFSDNDKLCVIKDKQQVFFGKKNQKANILKIAPTIEIVFVDLKGNNILQDLVKSFHKSKIYLQPQEKPPEGYEVKRGPKGGVYYESHVEIAPTPISEFKKFPSKLMELEIPKALYTQLLISNSSEDQIEYAYDIWAWYKKNKSSMSSEESRIFILFHRSINRKIRNKLKKDFNAHVGKPKISTTAKKIKHDLEDKTHEELKQNNEKFIASIIGSKQKTFFDYSTINSVISTISEIYPPLVKKFRVAMEEENARKFLLRTEELLKDLDDISDEETSREVQWEISNLRQQVIPRETWRLRYLDIIKDRGNYVDIHKFVNNLNFVGVAISNEKIQKIQELMEEALLKLSPEVIDRLTSEVLLIRIVDKEEFYMAATAHRMLIDKTFFSKQKADIKDSFISGFLHECTHLYEDVTPEFLRAEKRFFNKRTKNSQLTTSSAWGNNYDTYRDHWRDIYMGRLYHANFEITSMTIGEMMDEHTAYDSYIDDPELFLFAKETMFDSRYE